MRLGLLALLALVALASPGAAHAASRSSFGLDVSPPLEATPAELDRDLRDVARTGARLVRFELSWSQLEPERGRLDPAAFAKLDAAVRAARARRLRVFVLFLRTPCWASSAPAGQPCTRFGPRDPQDAVLAATTVARRYADSLAAFEIWNEPDHRNELYWGGPNKVSRYVALTKALYGPLKQAAPRVPVLAGSFVGGNGAWLEALYAAGMRGSYDALSVHFYDLTLTSLRQTREVMRRHGDASPVWLGETGWTSCAPKARLQDGHLCTTRRSQGRQTADLVRALRRTRWVRGALFYTVRDEPPTYDFGVVDRRGRLKPAGRALRSELRPRRTRATRRLSVRLVRTARGIRVTGTGPGADLYEVEAQSPTLRFRGFTRLTPAGRIVLRLPRELGTRGVTVRVRHLWTRRTVTRRL